MTTTVADEVARLGLASAARPDRDALDLRLTLNLAAAVGDHDEGRRLAAVFDRTRPGDVAFAPTRRSCTPAPRTTSTHLVGCTSARS